MTRVLHNLDACFRYDEIVKRGHFAWQLLWTGQHDCAYKNSYGCLGTTGTNYLVTPENCKQQLTAFCKADSQAQNRAMMFPFAGKDPETLPAFEEDLANFLLSRGPHAFLGHSWLGCSKTYAFPDALNADYGEPTELCHETSPGVFARDWTKAVVTMDCGTYKGSVTMKDTGKSVFEQ